MNENNNNIESVIIFLGGSTVENIQLEYKDRFTSKLESKLNNLGNVKTQVLNEEFPEVIILILCFLTYQKVKIQTQLRFFNGDIK